MADFLFLVAVVYGSGAVFALYIYLANRYYFFTEFHCAQDAANHLSDALKMMWLWFHPMYLIGLGYALADMLAQIARGQWFILNPMNTLRHLR